MPSPDLVVNGVKITIPDDLVEIADYDGSLKGFTCGSEPLDEFIREQAREYSDRHLGETWLLCSDGNLIAFYTLAPSSIPNEDYTGDEAPEMEKLDDFPYPVPALHIARLGVDDEWSSNGIGSELIDYIIVWAESQALPFWLIQLISKEESVGFYKELNFVTSGYEDDENGHTEMFYPLAPRIRR